MITEVFYRTSGWDDEFPVHHPEIGGKTPQRKDEQPTIYDIPGLQIVPNTYDVPEAPMPPGIQKRIIDDILRRERTPPAPTPNNWVN